MASPIVATVLLVGITFAMAAIPMSMMRFVPDCFTLADDETNAFTRYYCKNESANGDDAGEDEDTDSEKDNDTESVENENSMHVPDADSETCNPTGKETLNGVVCPVQVTIP